MTIYTPPRALVGSVQASGFPSALRGHGSADPKALIGQLQSAVEDWKQRGEGRIDAVEAALNEKIAALSINGPTLSRAGDGMPADPEYNSTFASYFRKGDNESVLNTANKDGYRGAVQAAMSVGTNSDGGYLAPVEWDRQIRQKLRDVSPMRSIAQVQPTSVGAFTTIWNNDVWGSGWVGETAARPETSNASLSQLTFESGEIYAMPAATQRLLDDSAINVETWLASSVETEFARQEGIAFISGNGLNKPRGLLTYVTGGASAGVHPGGNIATFNTESATDIPSTDTLLNFKYKLTAPYRQNARWLMNSQTAARIAKMKDLDGNYIWREGLIADEPSTLLGRPVSIDESMPDVAAGALPIAFGDFQSGYLINDRIGTRILRDPFTSKPFVLFYTTKRVGGGVLDPNAIKLMKVAVTV